MCAKPRNQIGKICGNGNLLTPCTESTRHEYGKLRTIFRLSSPTWVPLLNCSSLAALTGGREPIAEIQVERRK